MAETQTELRWRGATRRIAGGLMALAFALIGIALGLIALGIGLLNIAPLRQALLAHVLETVNEGETKVEIGDIGGSWPAELRLEGLAIADAEGTWLTLKEARLDWRPLALWRGEVHVTRLDVTGLDMPRLPAGGETVEETSDGPLIPSLPVDVVVDSFETREIAIGEPVIGEAIAFGATGSLSMTGSGNNLTLHAERTDGTPGRIDAEIALDDDIERGRLKLDLQDGAAGKPGIVAALSGMSEFAQVSLKADAQAREGLMTGRMTLDAGGALKLDANAHGGITEGTSLTFAADAEGSLVAENLSFADARKAHLETRIAAAGGDGYRIERLELEAGEMVLTGSGAVEALSGGGWGIGAEGTLTGLDAIAGIEEGAEMLRETGWRLEGESDSGFTDISIAEALLTTKAGKARFEGSVANGEEGFAVTGEAAAEITDLRPLGEIAGQQMAGSGTLELSSLRYDDRGGEADFSFETSAIATGDESLDALLKEGVTGEAAFAFGTDGSFKASGVTLTAAKGFTATGGFTLGADGALEGEAKIAAKEIGALAAGTATGALNATAAISGTMDAPGLTLNARLTKGTLAGMDAREAVLKAEIAQGSGPISFRMQGENGLAELETQFAMPQEGGARFDDIEANIFGARMEGAVALSDEGLASGSLSGRRMMLTPIGNLAGVPLEGRANIEIALTAPQGRQNVRATLTSRKIDMELTGSITLDRVEAEATVTDALGDGAIEAYFSAEGGGSGNTRFTQIKASAKGPLDRIAISAGIYGERLTVEAQPVAFNLDAVYEPSGVSLEKLDASIGEAKATLAEPATVELKSGLTQIRKLDLDFTGPKGAGGLEASMVLRARAADIDATIRKLPVELIVPFLPAQALGGTISGEADLDTGREQGDFSLSFDDVVLAEAGIDRLPPFNATLEANWAKRRLNISARAQGVSEEPFVLTGSLPLIRDPQGAFPTLPERGPIDARLDWQGPMASLMALADLPGQRLTGEADISLRAEGDISAPIISGRATIRGGTFENFETGTAMRDLDVTIEGERSERVRFTMTARDQNDGRMEAEGTASLAAEADPAVDMRMQLDNMELVRQRDLVLAMDGGLTLTGPVLPPSMEEPLRLEGELTTTDARFRIPDQIGGGVPHIDVIEVQGPEEEVIEEPQEPPPLPMMLDVTLKTGTSPAQVTGRGVNSLWTGSVRATGLVEDPALDGTLTAQRGTLDFAGKTFTLERGVVSFSGEKPIDPRIDIALTYSRSDFAATVAVTGRGSTPKIELSSEPSLPRDEIISRILFEKNVGELSAFEAAQLANTAAELSGGGIGGFGILNQIQNELGLDVLRVDTGASGGTTVSAGKYLREGVYVGVEQGALASDSNVKVEVDVTDNISVETKIGNDASSDVGVNWKWDY